MHCSRSSGVVSTSTRVSPYEITTDGRVRLSRASLLVHTAQLHPIIGTPALVPVPRNSSSIFIAESLFAAGFGFDFGHRLRVFRAVQAELLNQLRRNLRRVLALGISAATQEISPTAGADDHRLAAFVAVDVSGHRFGLAV